MLKDVSAAELKRLYVKEKLYLREIASRLGVSHQTVLNRLNRIGVPLRNRGTMRPTIDREILERLYIGEKQSVYTIANRLGISVDKVQSNLVKHGFMIERRPRWIRECPELGTLEIGDSITVMAPQRQRQYDYYYALARPLGIRISCSKLGSGQMRLTGER